MAYVTPPSVQARKRRVRTRLLESAAELFAQNGYENTTMQAIVKHAGTSIGNCYFYYRDKESLLRETTKRLCRRVDLGISRVAKLHPDANARMAAALWVGSIMMTRHRDLARILFVEASKTSARMEVLRFLRRRVELSFAGRSAPLSATGEVKFADGLLQDPQFITVAWTGAVWSTFEAVARDEIRLSPDDLGRRLVWWNLGALGLGPDYIEDIIRRVRDSIGENTRV
jgi:AcrR family transcriptional regulator